MKNVTTYVLTTSSRLAIKLKPVVALGFDLSQWSMALCGIERLGSTPRAWARSSLVGQRWWSVEDDRDIDLLQPEDWEDVKGEDGARHQRRTLAATR